MDAFRREALKDAPAPPLNGNSSGVAPHSRAAIAPLGARGHVLSAPKTINFPAGMRAGYPPGLQPSALPTELGTGLSLMLELQTEPNIPRAWRDERVLVLLSISHWPRGGCCGAVAGSGPSQPPLAGTRTPQHCQGCACAGAAAGLRSRSQARYAAAGFGMCLYILLPLSLGTNTVQISNVSRRESSQIVLRFRELIMVSREQDRSPSSAAGKAAAAPRRCREHSDPLAHGSQKH